jgi:hypothetical protein
MLKSFPGRTPNFYVERDSLRSPLTLALCVSFLCSPFNFLLYRVMQPPRAICDPHNITPAINPHTGHFFQ